MGSCLRRCKKHEDMEDSSSVKGKCAHTAPVHHVKADWRISKTDQPRVKLDRVTSERLMYDVTYDDSQQTKSMISATSVIRSAHSVSVDPNKGTWATSSGKLYEIHPANSPTILEESEGAETETMTSPGDVRLTQTLQGGGGHEKEKEEGKKGEALAKGQTLIPGTAMTSSNDLVLQIEPRKQRSSAVEPPNFLMEKEEEKKGKKK